MFARPSQWLAALVGGSVARLRGLGVAAKCKRRLPGSPCCAAPSRARQAAGVGASVLALLATLGVTVWVFQDRLGYDGLVYYVPFTFAVLLISLGADYNVFVVGRIWEEARRRPLRDAIAVAGSQASRAITVAGIALAASFALLALIPLQQFREVAVAMAAGIVIDAIVVRSLLVPALVALFGRLGMWPGKPAEARPR
jgi:putative drug exporter of the RND superfamily